MIDEAPCVRHVSRMDRNWRFHTEEGSVVPVALPHSPLDYPLGGFDESAYQRVWRYERTVRISEEQYGRGRFLMRLHGAMVNATISCNGREVATRPGGYLPIDCELTEHLVPGDNTLEILVDGTEDHTEPPFGGHIDYLAFAGLYRGVEMHFLPEAFIRDVQAIPHAVLDQDRTLEVVVTLDGPPRGLRMSAELLDENGQRVGGLDEGDAQTGATHLTLAELHSVQLWHVDTPRLYTLVVRTMREQVVEDEHRVRIGFRTAEFVEGQFLLNGVPLLLRGLNRHQLYPWVGAAMPDRAQAADADMLKKVLKLNAVRTSHYPQSPAFLDACDELGILVFEELPGWQHVGDQSWQDRACEQLTTMIHRDRNHPSIFIWGVRINESMDFDEFYTRTNAIARDMDPTRPTTGVRYFPESHLLEDVFSLNDFQTGGLILSPQHPHHIVSEYAGHMYPTKRYDNVERVQQHAILHATVLNNVAGTPGIAGSFGWCAFDYNTHAEFGSGDRICHHGVADMYRIPKPAASAYRSQCDPLDEVVLEPAFSWSGGDHSDYGGPGVGVIFSNCDRVEAYVGDTHAASLLPDVERFPHLAHPPFFFGEESGIAPWRRNWGDLRLEGYLEGRMVKSVLLSSSGRDADFVATVDTARLTADGSDSTRLVLRITDEYGNDRPLSFSSVTLEVEGPLTIVGDNPVTIAGGVAAVWLRAETLPGRASVVARHPRLGNRTIDIDLVEAPEELW